MKIEDRIYGTFSVEAPVLRELITTPSFERLKRIAQFGIPDRYYHLKNFSRHEHSLGVMILLNRLGASEEEQVAGLLHDVSHTAFSHVIDWVLGDATKEDYQDKQHESVVTNSEIADILKKYGYEPRSIANFERFPLLDRHAPDLCADRVDYAFREFPQTIAKECFGHVTVAHQRIVFDNQESAYLFAHNFLLLQINHWGGYEAVSRYRIFADVLRQAMAAGVIEYDDFWQDDEHVLAKLEGDDRN
jgi:HD superfamily phosphohydrolase